MRVGITFGTFDLLHVGHVNILRRAGELCDKLMVGVSSDKLNFEKKGKYPTYREYDRINIVSAIKYVDDVFLEESLDLKIFYILKYGASILVMGDDWDGKFDFCANYCEVVYLPRTPNISTTEIKSSILFQGQK